MRSKDTSARLQGDVGGAFILGEKIDDSKGKRDKESRRAQQEREARERRERKERDKAKRGKVWCGGCGARCSGEVLRVGERYFHSSCFTCRTCGESLARGGFFSRDQHYYCPADYQRAFGTRCAACRRYVEGEVVAALGNTYHRECFTCARCKRAFPSGERVTYTGSEVVCGSCMSPATNGVPAGSGGDAEERGGVVGEDACAGCGRELREGQALAALDRQWHPACFACGACGCVLAGEYMGRDGVPYCERDYQRLFGVRCAHCSRYIAGKVLQAGEQHHFHPTCARCTKCGDPFGDGEEMFLQGAAIWHPRCGPAPDATALDDRPCSELQFSLHSRTPSANGSYGSPYSSLTRKYMYRGGGVSPLDGGVSPHRITAYSYLTSEPAALRRPVQPSDRAPASPHFHRPHSAASLGGSGRASGGGGRVSGMRALVDSMRAETPRPKSPRMNNEEPIELSVYPAACKPPPGATHKMERDDFPAPPYPYSDPERRRRWSDTYRGVPDSDEDEPDARLQREEQELAKIGSGIARVFLREVKEREKLQQWRRQNLDPRDASRTPSASREAGARLRYSSPVGASPSRSLDHPRVADCSHSYSQHLPSYNVVSSQRGAPRPGYGLSSRASHQGGGAAPGAGGTAGLSARSHTFSSSTAGELTFSGLLGDKTQSTDFSSNKSDVSVGSMCDGVVGGVGVGGGLRGGVSGTRRSLPNMATSMLVHEPAKLYPYHLLLITNYRLPPDVDRLNLERHLSDAEFEAILQFTRAEFYRLPQWRRSELKRRARLF